MNVVIRTNKVGEYFTGRLQKCYFGIEGAELWCVVCESYSGGGREIDPLQAIWYKEKTKTALIDKLRDLAKRGRYVIKFSKSKKQ